MKSVLENRDIFGITFHTHEVTARLTMGIRIALLQLYTAGSN